MYKLLALLAISLLPACQSARPSFIDENYWEIASVTSGENLGGHFEGEEWVPDNPDVAMTYKVPDISAGFLFDVRALKVTPCLQIELLEVDSHIPYLGTLKLDFGVGYQRTYGYIGKLWTSIFEISTGVAVGWDFEERQLFYGVGATIIKF